MNTGRSRSSPFGQNNPTVSSKIVLSLILFLLISTGCGARPDNLAATTVPAPVITATLPAAFTPPAADTPLPPPGTPLAPSATPIEGTTSTQLNVRAEPSTAGNVLGILPASAKVQITGRDPAGNWLQILYPQGQDGKGWVTAQYVTTANGTAVPVIGGDSIADPNGADTAIVQQQINVRSGPGTSFNSLGTLNPKDVVRLTGKDANSAWLQIEYPNGPDGKGWINAAFVQARGVENLPIVSEAGQTIGTGTPTGIPPTSTPTVFPAASDDDSQTHPIANVIFEPMGTQTLIYSGDVSSPEGDVEDWIQFTPDTDMVLASLECYGKLNLQVDILENGQPSPLKLACGEREKSIPVKPGAVYMIHLQAAQSQGGLQYFPYKVTIRTSR
jgi:uncharacterized protein YraI